MCVKANHIEKGNKATSCKAGTNVVLQGSAERGSYTMESESKGKGSSAAGGLSAGHECGSVRFCKTCQLQNGKVSRRVEVSVQLVSQRGFLECAPGPQQV